MSLIMNISEGQRYKVANVKLAGDIDLYQKQLMALIEPQMKALDNSTTMKNIDNIDTFENNKYTYWFFEMFRKSELYIGNINWLGMG